MASAAILSLEEFRDTRRRGEIRQRLHCGLPLGV